MRRGEFVLDRIERLPKGFAINSEDYLAPGDFLFNTRNTFEMAGKGATWRIGQGKYTFNSNIARIRFSCLDSYFMNYLYNTEQVIEQVRARVTGTTSVAAVYLDSLNTVQIAFPELGEQRRIGTFFTDLDSLITLHQRMCPIFCFCAHGLRTDFASILQGLLRVLRYPRPVPKMIASPSAPASGVFDAAGDAFVCGSSSAGVSLANTAIEPLRIFCTLTKASPPLRYR